MSYHDLSECTLSPEERMTEANEIIDMFDLDKLSDIENSMVMNVTSNGRCSVKQLFWLCDIKDRVL